MSSPIVNTHPFPHLVLDNLFGLDHLAAVRAAWPAPAWPGWVRYDPRYEGKRASDRTTALPAPVGSLLARMASLPLAGYFDIPGAVPDLSLHGSGLHESGRGEHLGLHLDAEQHPRLGLQRVLSCMIYVQAEWREEWGGKLQLWDSRRTTVKNEISPMPGRMVVFDCRGEAYHAVSRLECPGGNMRRSVTLFWYAPASRMVTGGRHRALFVTPFGQEDGLEADRQARAFTNHVAIDDPVT